VSLDELVMMAGGERGREGVVSRWEVAAVAPGVVSQR